MAYRSFDWDDSPEDKYDEPLISIGGDGTYESVICSACNGSGEGMYDGSTCSTCRGSGEVLELIPDDEPEEA